MLAILCKSITRRWRAYMTCRFILVPIREVRMGMYVSEIEVIGLGAEA